MQAIYTASRHFALWVLTLSITNVQKHVKDGFFFMNKILIWLWTRQQFLTKKQSFYKET